MRRKRWQLGIWRQAFMFGFIKLCTFLSSGLMVLYLEALHVLIYFPRLQTIFLWLSQLPEAYWESCILVSSSYAFSLDGMSGLKSWKPCPSWSSSRIWPSVCSSPWTLPVSRHAGHQRGFICVGSAAQPQWSLRIFAVLSRAAAKPTCCVPRMFAPHQHSWSTSTNVDTEMGWVTCF